jgi:osmotically-inducible protein OsmY
VAAAERRKWFDTPFDQAVAGAASCPRPEGPLITADEMRQQAHGRIERGTSCWLAKKCEDSNVYRRDPEIQTHVLHAIRSEPLAARSSVWITTERRYVTLQGCVDFARLGCALIERVRTTDGVEGVFDQLIVGTRRAPRWTVDPAWRSGSR